MTFRIWILHHFYLIKIMTIWWNVAYLQISLWKASKEMAILAFKNLISILLLWSFCYSKMKLLFIRTISTLSTPSKMVCFQPCLKIQTQRSQNKSLLSSSSAELHFITNMSHAANLKNRSSFPPLFGEIEANISIHNLQQKENLKTF